MKAEILDKVKHAKLRYHKDEVPAAPFALVAALEVAPLANDIPVVFTDEANPRLLALLGKTKNVLIDENFPGATPASVQNYPFFLARNGDKNMLCVDLDAPQLSGEGKPLFEGGEPSEFTQKLIEIMKNYHQNLELTAAAALEIKNAGVLESMELGVSDGGEKKTLLSGFLVANLQKLNALDDATLANWARRGILELVYNHLRSLANLQKLADKIEASES